MSDASPPLPATPKPRERNWDAYAAVIASLMAVLALVVAAYTANLQRQQVRAQVWPRLEMTRHDGRALMVSNNGVGPARIRGVRVEVDGRVVKNWADLLRGLGLEPQSGGSTLNRRVLAPGQFIHAFQVSDDDKGRALFRKAFVESEKRFGVLVCYCSVLDQCWLAGGGGPYEQLDHDAEVDACPIAAADQFQR